VRPELEEQRKIFDWKWAQIAKGNESLWLSGFVPNGTAFLNRFGVMLGKRYGVLAGFPDLFFLKPVGSFHGLFIELKRRGPWGRTERRQRLMGDLLQKNGYRFRTCRGSVDAIREISDYEHPG
jgi:hypothetical protein